MFQIFLRIQKTTAIPFSRFETKNCLDLGELLELKDEAGDGLLHPAGQLHRVGPGRRGPAAGNCFLAKPHTCKKMSSVLRIRGGV